MVIERKRYLEKLVKKRGNGLVKVITGLRRSGKSYLLFEIYRGWLLENGVKEDHIIALALDDLAGARYRNPLELDAYIRSRITDDEMYYVFIDEIQMVSEIKNPYVPGAENKLGFIDVLLGLMKIKNADIYVTGSNSKMLSSDVLTMFRGRGDEIRVYPLSYAEFYNAYEGNKGEAWKEYFTYGGMPYVMALNSHEEKSAYLKDLFSKTYITDVLEHNNILNEGAVLEDLLNILSSAVGSLTNPRKLSSAFKSMKKEEISANTISRYIEYFADAFMVERAYRYDIKGKKYMETPLKYYFTDVGLRNARLNFRQQEENHIMENIIFNELKVRGYDVDVGVVEYNHKNQEKKSVRSQLEVDFVASKGNEKMYVQSALTVADEEKRQQEISSLQRINDSFKKIVVVKDAVVPWYDENGIEYVGIEDFLLGKN